ncbi:hypothetical protein EVAR_83502_1 [Eumeta japonica]|uniref:Uncharacterized protein n=1 Tax=Eumeta variegata TaxID=151549 RepID=A0A4C1Y2K5_EUMVA|nr:hypothetical protein EVAR_83502_1 [Eumeta japonica]
MLKHVAVSPHRARADSVSLASSASCCSLGSLDHRHDSVAELSTRTASATSATADGLAPEGASQTKKFCLQVIKKRPRKKFCLQVIKKRPRKPDVADVHEWCSAATVSTSSFLARLKLRERPGTLGEIIAPKSELLRCARAWERLAGCLFVCRFIVVRESRRGSDSCCP